MKKNIVLNEKILFLLHLNKNLTNFIKKRKIK